MTARAESLDAWSTLQNSPLLQRGGYLVTRLVTERGLAVLAREAFARHSDAREHRRGPAERLDEARGQPDQWLESAPGGEALATFFANRAVAARLQKLTLMTWAPSGLQGAYSYYHREGHYLGMHRDVDICDLAIITCIHDDGGDPESKSGALSVYPTRMHEELQAVRDSPTEGEVVLRLAPGESLILLGGAIPHHLNPIEAGRTRIVAPLCYQAVV